MLSFSSSVKKNKPGKMTHRDQRILVINLYKKLKINNPTISYKDIVHQLAEDRGIGTHSVRKILSEYKRSHTVTSPNKTKHRPTFKEKVDECDKTAIRRKVHEFYFNKDLPTLNKLLQAVNNDENLPNFKQTTFYSLLKELNFTYTNRVLTERDDIIIWRRNYLRSIRRFREEGRHIYYMGETWISSGDVTNKVSKDETPEKNAFLQEEELTAEPATPRKKDKGLIVLHIGSAAGFVSNGLLCFESIKNTRDHHDEIGGDTFLQWFENILPLLEKKAVIVVNNATYYSTKKENLPNTSWKKTDIIRWLENKGREVLENMTKAELLQIVTHDKDKFDKYVIEEIARANNKKVLRLPPHYCELNPIEIIWAMVKEYVRDNNTTYNLEDVQLLLNQGIEQITAENWCKCIKQVRDEEKKMWEVDNIADTLIDASLANNSHTVITVTDRTFDSDSDVFDSDF